MGTEKDASDLPIDDTTFFVDLFNKDRRFPLWTYISAFLAFRYRWSLYVYIPVVAVLFLCRMIYVGIENGKIDEWGATLAVGTLSVLSIVFCVWWYYSAPYWYLNGLDREWNSIRHRAERNGHLFPDSFYLYCASYNRRFILLGERRPRAL